VHARFYAPDAERANDVVMLPPEEAQHLKHVLRLKAGASVRVFNGRGGEFDAVVERTGRDGAQVRVGDVRDAAAEATVAVTLAQAVLKSDRTDAVIRDAVMMGVAAVQPVVTARSEVSLQALLRGHRRERWERIAVSSAKQCGRAVVPAILEPRPFGDVAASLGSAAASGAALMFVEPAASAVAVSLSDLAETAPRKATVIVGPEGGWTPGEIETGTPVARLVTLGGRTLRADAMPIVALTALLTHWHEL
jgi:16S rRNA (uracil1498-N3)-methyltransferase